MKVLVLGDIGGAGGYHAGDEAMAEAVVAELAARTDLEVVAVSGNVPDTSARYGWHAVPRIGFPVGGEGTDAARDVRLDAVLRAARGEAGSLAWDDPAWEVIHAVAAVDGVLISGGDALASIVPEHLYERVAVAALAEMFTKPLVVTSQTVGPHLASGHGGLVGRVVGSAALVAARDEDSYRLMRALGASEERAARVVDDATYLAPDEVTVVPEGPYVVATFAGSFGVFDDGSLLGGYAALLDDVAKRTSCSIVFVAHHGAPDAAGSDSDVHRRVAALLETADVRFVDDASARQIVTLTRSAAFVVSSRYHALVFALGAGVPSLGVAVDDYTTRKLSGAMERFGLGHFVVPSSALVGYSIAPVVGSMLEDRALIAGHLAEVNGVRRPEHAAWWDRVLAALAGEPVTGSAPTLALVPAFDAGPWAAGVRGLRRWSAEATSRYLRQTLALEAKDRELAALSAVADDVHRQLAETEAHLDEEKDRVALLQQALTDAHAIISDRLGPVEEWFRTRPQLEAEQARADSLEALLADQAATTRRETARARGLAAELEALRGTKTFRLAAAPRRLYGRLRRR